MLALTFADPAAYDDVEIGDKLDVLGADELEPGVNLVLRVRKANGAQCETELVHTYHEGQIPWLQYGSALNFVKARRSTY